MKPETVLERLEATGIRMEEETAVPIDGAAVPVPYMVVRATATDEYADAGRIGLTTTKWTVTLFTANKDIALECKIRKALYDVGRVEVTPYPDGEPYATNFAFATKGVIKHE